MVLEFDNYEMIIKDNLGLKEFVDNALPVRDQMPAVLTALVDHSGNASREAFYSLQSVYDEYNSLNKTFWSELQVLEDTYTFKNPWTFTGASFFTLSIATTVGYGTFTPQTGYGQLVVVFCSLPMISLTILFCRKNIYLFKTSICMTTYDSFGLLSFFFLSFLFLFLAFGGYVLSLSEG